MRNALKILSGRSQGERLHGRVILKRILGRAWRWGFDYAEMTDFVNVAMNISGL